MGHDERPPFPGGRRAGCSGAPQLTETRAVFRCLKRILGNVWLIEEARSEDRVTIQFKVAPTAEIFARLKALGFRWSPTRRAWVRTLSNGGSHEARGAVSTWRA
jgi:hypothetical protein